MKEFVRCGVLWLSLVVLGIGFSGCKAEPSTITNGMAEPGVSAKTPDPAIARTLQADVAMTAVGLLTLTPAAQPSLVSTPVVEPARSVGTPPGDRKGACPVPGGFALQNREGFCVAVPVSWVIWNADGGAVSFLSTTPDQVIALQPNWAQSTSVCNLMIYVSSEESALSHLDLRHRQFSGQKDIQALSPIKAHALGEMGILGFTWSYKNEDTGAIFAEMVGVGRLLHISFDGSDCMLEDMLPVLETLRINY